MLETHQKQAQPSTPHVVCSITSSVPWMLNLSWQILKATNHLFNGHFTYLSNYFPNQTDIQNKNIFSDSEMHSKNRFRKSESTCAAKDRIGRTTILLHKLAIFASRFKVFQQAATFTFLPILLTSHNELCQLSSFDVRQISAASIQSHKIKLVVLQSYKYIQLWQSQ